MKFEKKKNGREFVSIIDAIFFVNGKKILIVNIQHKQKKARAKSKFINSLSYYSVHKRRHWKYIETIKSCPALY